MRRKINHLLIKPMKKKIIATALVLLGWNILSAQKETSSVPAIHSEITTPPSEKEPKKPSLKISGYIQSYMQWGMPKASLSVGSGNESSAHAFARIGVRRGRLKASYSDKMASGVLQIDVTEKGIGLKDAYIQVKVLGNQFSWFRVGVFNRPFGHEIGYSSSLRESPERSTIVQTLFPNERDLGGMIALQAPKNSEWYFLQLNAGLVAGNGIKQASDSRFDFVGRLSASKVEGNSMKWGIGGSFYYGGVYQGSATVFSMTSSGFVANEISENIGRYSKRIYAGVDGQLSFFTDWGLTQIRAEWIGGRQPGNRQSSKSPNSSTLPKEDTFVRPFQGGYLLCVQDWGTLPVASFVKYDWYDPNTLIQGNSIGEWKNTGPADIMYQTIGMGIYYHLGPSLKLTGYYERVYQEVSSLLATYDQDRKDDRITLALQYKF